ncbi:hypothetical protein MTR_2g460640 [Medicago truncatula]|uniref:RNA-directed DNA polymerase n=1 Tax=Medicago truncatula TaxID=3880 RepID=A0A072V8V8_MEDTR|nr:hypothetical protein MTR_2g460640 [Medicago truncatula]
MSVNPALALGMTQKQDFSEKEYRGMIDSLLYLTASRPDIVFAVGLCARFQTAPKESHYIAIKRILRYLVGTPSVGLWYKKGTHFDLMAYCDADYAGDKIERKIDDVVVDVLVDRVDDVVVDVVVDRVVVVVVDGDIESLLSSLVDLATVVKIEEA